jgi:primosomal replication protein N''
MQLIRYCPNCQTERALSENFCEGSVDGGSCHWNLIDLPIVPIGWRPEPIVTTAVTTLAHQAAAACVNGHAVEAGDLLCAVCGADVDHVTQGSDEQTQSEQPAQTVISGWRVLRELASTGRRCDTYLVEEDGADRQGTLTLYHHGYEPDPAIYDVLRRIPREHVPDLMTAGRWNERAFEVTEALTGEALADLGIVAQDEVAIRRIAYELGKALHALGEAGIRHRDIRPATLLVRNRDPLDLVIGGFGSARLSEFDLDIVSPLEITRYTAPEAVAGGVAAASDWWSLGIVLLEQITAGQCFEGIHEQAYLIHVLAHGVSLPPNLPASVELLLRGLLARDRMQRWKWPQVQAWLAGEAPEAPPAGGSQSQPSAGPALRLNGRAFSSPQAYALAAAEEANWPVARDQLMRGELVTWAQDANLSPQLLASLRRISTHDSLDDDGRLMLALTSLNSDMPLVFRGAIVSPQWLLQHPLEAYALISGPIPDLLQDLGP